MYKLRLLVEGVVEVVREFADGFYLTGDERHTGLETEVERRFLNIMFSEEGLDVEDLGFIGFIGYRIKGKIHISLL